MTNQDYKAILTALRDEIRGRKRDMEIGRHADPIDQIIDQQNRDQNATLASNDRARLREIEAALLRIEDGSYAECIDCDGPIAPARLNALPYAARCVRCEEQHEQSIASDPIADAEILLREAA